LSRTRRAATGNPNQHSRKDKAARNTALLAAYSTP
jgi:hypothetical protein